MKPSKRRQAVQHNQDISIPSEQDKPLLSLDDSLDLFINYQHASNRSEATLKDYKTVVGLFLRYIAQNRQYGSVEQIVEADIVTWLSYLRRTPNKWGRAYSSRSIETYARDVAVFFRWLVQHKHLHVNPMLQVEKPKAEKVLIRVFVEDELKLLDAACNRTAKGRSLTEDERKALSARDRAFLWLLLSTGLRVSEACGLTFADVDWREGMVYVDGKGAKERKIPFGSVARHYLDTYIRYWRGESVNEVKGKDHIFLTAFGTPLSVAAVQRIFDRLKENAGIIDKRVSPHTCRHWFAVNAIRNGMPTVVLKGILGHENWDMIEVYVQLAEQDLKEAYARFSPVDALTMHKHPKEKRAQMRDWRMARRKGNTY